MDTKCIIKDGFTLAGNGYNNLDLDVWQDDGSYDHYGTYGQTYTLQTDSLDIIVSPAGGYNKVTATARKDGYYKVLPSFTSMVFYQAGNIIFNNQQTPGGSGSTGVLHCGMQVPNQ